MGQSNLCSEKSRFLCTEGAQGGVEAGHPRVPKRARTPDPRVYLVKPGRISLGSEALAPLEAGGHAGWSAKWQPPPGGHGFPPGCPLPPARGCPGAAFPLGVPRGRPDAGAFHSQAAGDAWRRGNARARPPPEEEPPTQKLFTARTARPGGGATRGEGWGGEQALSGGPRGWKGFPEQP